MNPFVTGITRDPIFFLLGRNFKANMAIFVSVNNFGAIWAVEVIFVLKFTPELLWVRAVRVGTGIFLLFSFGDRTFVSICLTPEISLLKFSWVFVGVIVSFEVRHVVGVSWGGGVILESIHGSFPEKCCVGRRVDLGVGFTYGVTLEFIMWVGVVVAVV